MQLRFFFERDYDLLKPGFREVKNALAIPDLRFDF
jgi:hypothetical protein